MKPGQALVMLLVFVSTATIITTAAVSLTIINSRATSKLAQGEEALMVAGAAAETAIIRTIRNPAGYTGETGLNIGNGTAQVTVADSPGDAKIIISTGTIGTISRKVQVIGTYNKDNDNKFIPFSWEEIN